MKLIIYNPKPPLSHYIDKIWYSESVNFESKGTTLPLLHHELIFNFSEYFAVHTLHQPQPLLSNASSWLGGLQTMPMDTVTKGRHETMGVLFKPWGLQPITGIQSIDLLNVTVDSELILGKEITTITQKISEAGSVAEKFVVLENFLLQKYQLKHIPGYIAKGLLLLKKTSSIDGIINHMAGEAGISNKTLIQSFKKYIGLTPSRFLHLQLINNALTDMAACPEQSLTHIAYQHHFFDQSHFNHLFKSFTGITPSTYRKMVLTGRVRAQSPNYIENFSDSCSLLTDKQT